MCPGGLRKPKCELSILGCRWNQYERAADVDIRGFVSKMLLSLLSCCPRLSTPDGAPRRSSLYINGRNPPISLTKATSYSNGCCTPPETMLVISARKKACPEWWRPTLKHSLAEMPSVIPFQSGYPQTTKR